MWSLSVGTAPTGASAIFDVNKNGIDYLHYVGKPTHDYCVQLLRPYPASQTLQHWLPGDYLTVDVYQIGSTVAGANAVIRIQVV